VWPRTPEQVAERALRTLSAADAFRIGAPAIAEACSRAGEHEVVVAVVNKEQEFAGAKVVLLGQLREHIVYDGGWHLVFSPGCSVSDVEARSSRMARLAKAKLAVVERWRNKRG
jgi:hypothetical protein